MLEVKKVEEVSEILNNNFSNLNEYEEVDLKDALNRVSYEDIKSLEDVPSFNRSTVDGYAIKSKDSYGVSENSPSILSLQGKVEMGKEFKDELKKDSCIEVPTGGMIPCGADSVEMYEYSEDYNDGTIGILKPIAINSNIIFKGDDLKINDIVINKGRVINPIDIASLASVGISKVKVNKKLSIGIISTGDELVDINDKVNKGQIRNTNSILLSTLITSLNHNYKDYGIIKDDEKLLSQIVDKAIEENDLVLISGGSSAGKKDVISKLLSLKGDLLFHGIAIKPGKPTMCAKIKNKPVFGLAGHPLAVLFCFILFVKPLIYKLINAHKQDRYKEAVLMETIDSNHGRTSVIGLKLINENNTLKAYPIITKSGLITSLRQIDAYTIIDREVEGIKSGERIKVYDVI